MLTLEKSSRSSDVTMRFRIREPFFNRLFIYALASALTFHFGAFLLFHIQPFPMGSLYLYPPIHVETEGGILSSVLALEETKEPLTSSIAYPPFLELSLPAIPTALLDLSQAKEEKIELHHNYFSAAERESLKLEPFIAIPVYYNPIQIRISGGLSNRQIIQDAKPAKSVKASPLNYLKVVYQAIIDNHSGQVFWYELMHSTGDLKKDQKAEEILRGLRFAVTQNDLNDLQGEVEIVMVEPI